MKQRPGFPFRMALLLAAKLCLSHTAHAFTHTESLGATRITVHAPSWTWQARDINILLIVRNEGSRLETLSLELIIPAGEQTRFAYDGETQLEIACEPGATRRAAFTGITATKELPPGDGQMQLAMRSEAGHYEITYPVKVVRGAVVAPGALALYAPAGVTLVWCLVFAAAMARMAGWRAWMAPGKPAGISANPPDWAEDAVGNREV